MMLVQKPTQFPTAPHHRRHPSAPVVVQPTRTPGLLSLSMAKPTPSKQQQQPQQQHQRSYHRSPKSKPAATANRSPKPAQAEASVSEATETTAPSGKQQPTPAPSPDKNARGRQQGSKPPKDKMTRRSDSPSIPNPPSHGRRNNTRQPSPVQTRSQTSQAEGPSFANHGRNAKSNLFDPFVVSSDSDSDNTASGNSNVRSSSKPAMGRPTPKLTANPSGKLARRRQPASSTGSPTPAPSKAVPVPRNNNRRGHSYTHSAMMNVSRSAPSAASPAANNFPICDDSNDADDLTPPTTPTRGAGTWQQTLLAYDDGPRTAPLTSTSGFNFPARMVTPSPSSRRQGQHLRSPSEGVFNMSFDEDSSSSDSASEELKMLFGLLPNKRASLPVSSNRGPAHLSAKAKASLYASSLFQNSPSPDELPPPAF